MILFSILWIPTLYLFVNALQKPRDLEKKGFVLAILGGCLTGIFYFFFPNLLSSGAFGFMRWLHGFVDVVALPVLIPLLFRYILQIRYKHQKYLEIAQFVLIWLIPVSLVKSIQWNINKDFILLVLTPLLWSAQGIGIPYLLNRAAEEIGFISFLFYTLAFMLPFGAVTLYWSAFSKMYFIAVPLLVLTLIPAVWHGVRSYIDVTKG